MKYLLSAVLLSICFISTAQVDEEAVYLTGGVGFSTGDASQSVAAMGTSVDAEATMNSFNVGLGGGYMFSEMFGAGINFDFQSSGVDVGVDSISTNLSSNLFTITPQARMYIEIDEPLYFTGNLNIGFGFGKQSINVGVPDGAVDDTLTGGAGGTDLDERPNISTLDISLRPGFTYFFSDNLALDLTLGRIGYRSTTTEYTIDFAGTTQTVESTSGEFSFLADLRQVTLGVTYMFNN